MEASILTGTKKILGIAEEYEAFDPDILTHINSTLSILLQIGLGPPDGFVVEDKTDEWSDLGLTPKVENMVRTYLYLKVRLLFDPPTTSYLIEAMKDQVQEHEHRLLYFGEEFV